MQEPDVIGGYLRTYPRESMKLLACLIVIIWQSVPTVIAVLLYLFLAGNKNTKIRGIVVSGILLALISLWLESGDGYLPSWNDYLAHGWVLNKAFWGLLINNDPTNASLLIAIQGFNYLMGLPLLLASGLLAIDLLPLSAHQKSMTELQQGKLGLAKELEDHEIKEKLARLNNINKEGTVLGVSMLDGEPVIVKDHEVNHVALVLGTTGGGKTITLRRFFESAMRKKYPLIIVDGKPTDENVEWIKDRAENSGQPFYGFNCGNFSHYDALAHGGYTELKDKIISLKDQWENDYYRSIAEDYLQTTFEVLLRLNKPFDLATVVSCLSYDELVLQVRNSNNKELMSRIKSLENYESKDITGLQAHLNLLINSELGEYFKVDETTFNLADAIHNNAVVYFALPALRFPSFSKVLGKLVINDLKAVIDRNNNEKRIFTVFDEFSVFAGEQVLNLVNMGRGKGVHAIFGTQGLGDLEKVEMSFKDQMLNCVNTLICHRLNDQNSAESMANWIGTKDAFTVTAQLNINSANGGLGTVRQSKQYIVHPDDIKQGLQTGEAYLIKKSGGFKYNKIKIKYI